MMADEREVWRIVNEDGDTIETTTHGRAHADQLAVMHAAAGVELVEWFRPCGACGQEHAEDECDLRPFEDEESDEYREAQLAADERDEDERCYLLNQGDPWGSYHEAAEVLDRAGVVFVPVEWNGSIPHEGAGDDDRDAVAAALRDFLLLGFGDDATFAVEVDEPGAEGTRSDWWVTWGVEVRTERLLRVVLGVDPWRGPASRYHVVVAADPND